MKLLIVIPHYGSDDLLKGLLPTIGCEFETREGDYEIISQVPGVTVLIINNNSDNRGFTKACNLGLIECVEGDYDACWLLNNDTEVVDIKMAIAEIERELRDHPDTGIMGFKILSMEDPDFIHHAGTGDPIPAGVHKVGRVSQNQYEERGYERWVTGASLVITRACAREVGLMDSHMVNYYSDSDYCYRARYAKHQVVYIPVEVKHQIGQSSNPSKDQERVMKGDMLVFYSKWITGKAFSDLNMEVLPNIVSA